MSLPEASRGSKAFATFPVGRAWQGLSPQPCPSVALLFLLLCLSLQALPLKVKSPQSSLAPSGERRVGPLRLCHSFLPAGSAGTREANLPLAHWNSLS